MDQCFVTNKGFDGNCFRKKANIVSVSKIKACGWKDGLYNTPLQFKRIFNGYGGFALNDHFAKSNSRLYYVISEGIAEGEGSTDYLYTYNCKTKKTKQLKSGFNGALVWVDVGGNNAYLSQRTLGYMSIPQQIWQINTINDKIVMYELLTRIEEFENGSKNIVPGSFKWGTSLQRFVIDYIIKYGIEKYNRDYLTSINGEGQITSASSIATIGVHNFINPMVRLHNISNGSGQIIFQRPGFDVVGWIDFNKKTIK